MRSRFFLAASALLGALGLSNGASAQSLAYAVPGGSSYMRAGPGFDYPVIAYIRGGSAVTVYGCLPDWSWCDASVQRMRGWVSTTRLQFQYGGNLVPIPRYYSYFDAPTVTFDFGYWDRYYQDEPFYRDYYRHRRHHDRGRNRDHRYDQTPGIFPEEGGPPIDRQDGGGHRHRDRNRDGGNRSGDSIFPEEGGSIGQPPREDNGSGRRHRRDNPPPDVYGGPPQSAPGDAGPPAISDDSARGRQGSGEACPPGSQVCP